MIKIEVEDYCQNCLDFEADVAKPERLYSGCEPVTIFGDTVVRCEYRKRCASIKRYLEKQIEKGGDK